MADLKPFLSTPAQWVDELARCRADRKRIEEREDALREKLRAYMSEKSVTSLDGAEAVAKVETRESVDFSQGALGALYGDEWLADARSRLPRKIIETLVVRDLKKAAAKSSDVTGRQIADALFPDDGQTTKKRRL